MLFQDKYFRKSSMIGMAWIRKWTPQNAKDKKGWLKLKAQDSTFHF